MYILLQTLFVFMHEYSVCFPFLTPVIKSCSVILAEQIKLAQLHHFNEELEEVKKQRQPGTTAVESQRE